MLAIRDGRGVYGNGPNLATKSINKIPDEKESHWVKSSLTPMEQEPGSVPLES